ncbi:hypothetical protein FB45DRAFT_872015 [Roridomyces roridus]|uniref:Uncharacterized protein n=1 Tax=Roridomyces roridus TaxID=1738132 RepID=A0AAD7BF16_9AGAR|nr:hypothetical protein FB45DRAFT_872015 [Roridomyces roridus]
MLDPDGDEIFLQLLVSARFAPNGNVLVKEVSRRLRISGTDTMRGLKKCHESFETIDAALDNVYARSREHSDDQVASDRLASAILSIYSRMGEDNILRKRILSETRFLERAMALLASPWARENVVIALGRISDQHDGHVLQAIARFTPTILDCAEPHLGQLNFVEKIVGVLTRAMASALFADTPDPEIQAALPRLLRFMLSVVHLPGSSSLSFDYLCIVCHQVALSCPALLLSNPDAIEFLVACARSPDLYTRITSQRALIDACAQFQLASTPENAQIVVERTSGGLFESAQAYYRDREPFIATLRKDEEKLEALADEYETNPNCSHSELGQELAALILHREMTIRGCTYHNARGGAELLEMLRVCEAAVRKDADETNQLNVTADVLRIHILVSQGELNAASNYAQEALKRHPSVPFFYYILASLGCCGDRDISKVLYADKGLQYVDGMTDYLQQELLYLTVCYSHLVVARMAQASPSELRVNEVNALINKALANTNTFFQTVTQMDHSHMPLMTAVGE